MYTYRVIYFYYKCMFLINQCNIIPIKISYPTFSSFPHLREESEMSTEILNKIVVCDITKNIIS